MNEKNFHFQWRILNVYKINAMYFSALICQFLLIGFKVCVSKISDKTVKFLLNYNNFLGGSLLSGHSVACRQPYLKQRTVPMSR